MAGDGRVIIDIFGDDSGFRKALNGLGNITKAGMQAVTTGIGVASTALAGFGAYAVRSGAEFETSLAKASTLFGNVSVDVDNLSAQLLRVSTDTGVAAADLGNSLYNALSAGIPATEDMADATLFLEKSAKLAKAGFTDIDTALTATAKTINAYGMSVEDADKIQKVMIQTQNLGITTVGELGASLAQVTPTAAAFGVSFEQVGAALANMTAQGTPTAQATTQLNALIAELGKAGTLGAKGLEAAAAGTKYAGMNFKQMMDSGATLNEVLDLMATHAEDAGLSMVDLFSSIEAGKSAMAISGDNSAKFASNLVAMSTEADVVGDAYEKMASTLQASTERIGTSFQNLGIQVYQSNEGTIAEIAKQLADMVNDMNTSFKEDGFNGLATSMGTSLAGIVGMISAYLPQMIAGGVQMIGALLQGLTENAPTLANGAINIISSFVGGIVSLLPQLARTGTDLVVQFAIGLTQSLPTIASKAVEIMSQLIQGFVGNLDQIISTGIDLLVALGEGIISAIPQLMTQMPQIVISICDAINNNAGKLFLSAAKLLFDLGIGLIRAIPTLIANIPVIIEAIVKAFIAFNWLNLGATLIKGIASGLKGAANFAGNEAKNVANLVKRHIAELPAELLQIGQNIVKGLANGIKGGAKWAVDAIQNLAGSMLDGIKNFFGIHSPSAIMRDEVGKNIVLGAAEGIAKNAKTAIKAAEDFSAGVLDASTSWVNDQQFYNDLEKKGIGDFTLPIMVTNDPEGAEINAQTVIGATTDLVESMAQSVTDNQPKVTAVTKELATCYITTVDIFREQYRNAGYRMVQGLWEGIASGKSMLINNIVWMLEEAVAAAKEAMDINSPSRVWETEIGVQMAAGAGVGFVKQMRGVSAQMQNALTAETEKMSAKVSISAAQSVSKETAASRVETYYVNSTVEKTPIIEFKGEMAALGRLMQPYIRVEEKRKGGTLVKGNGANV